MTPKHPEELFIALLRSAYGNACHGLVKRRPTIAQSKLPAARHALSYLSVSRTQPMRLAQVRQLSALSTQQRTPAKTNTKKPPPPKEPVREIAVLGGGITGLTAAHYLSRHAKNAHITLYEASDRLGGWIDGQPVKVDDGHSSDAMMQRGPRMLRSGATTNKYDDLVFYDVVANLKLRDKIIYPKGVAETRYVYYPDHLVQLPKPEQSLQNIINTIKSLLTEPLWTGFFLGALNWAKQSHNSLDAVAEKRRGITDLRRVFDKDESVADFLGRMLGSKNSPIIDNLVSGMLHGIYGGDVHKLSAKHTIFESFWHQDMLPLLKGQTWVAKRDLFLKFDILDGPNQYAVVEMAEKARNKNLIAFSDGLVTLVNSLKEDLANSSNVTIKTRAPVSALELEGDKVAITSGGKSARYDHTLSTLFSGHLAQLAKPANSLPSLAETEAVSIMVVNLWYPNPDLLKENPGFGYLIPQSVPPEENPECALGVLFDSDIEMGQEAPATKLTVMLGGHYWSDWSVLPDEDTGIAMAMAVVERHLGISPDEKVQVSAKLCRDCIPQHNVGHLDRLRRAHYELASAFQGKLTVAGPSYTSVGVIPAMRAGHDAAMRIARGQGQPWSTRLGQESSMWDGHFRSAEFAEKEFGANTTEFKPLDFVGTTGLEWTTESPMAHLGEIPSQYLWFKRSTRKEIRLVDDAGNWSEAAHELLKVPTPNNNDKKLPNKKVAKK